MNMETQKKLTLDQCRAGFAYKAVASAKSRLHEKKLENYATQAKGVSAMVLQCGIGQTVAFLMSKVKEGDGNSPHGMLLQQIGEWLGKDQRGILDGPPTDMAPHEWLMSALLDVKASSDQWIRARQETIAIGVWLKRFSEALINTEKPDNNTDEGG